MPDGTTYSGSPHSVADPMKLTVGQKLDTEFFPLVSN